MAMLVYQRVNDPHMDGIQYMVNTTGMVFNSYWVMSIWFVTMCVVGDDGELHFFQCAIGLIATLSGVAQWLMNIQLFSQ
jgi:hypothetical protein